jgi:DNA-binding transcriptional LysR family regulator
VSQPPLSRQIRGHEAELKVKLLDRNTQGVRLTRAGHAVLARDAEALRAEAQTIDKESEEELRIGYAPSPTAVIISGVPPDIMSCHREQALASTILPTLRCCRG